MAYATRGGAPTVAEGVPPNQYLLMVQANELVAVNRKISASAASLEQLEEILAQELNLPMPIGVCTLDPATNAWAQVPSVAQMPLKAKVRVQPLQPRGPSPEELRAAAARASAFKQKQAEEENRMREEKMRMKEREFEVARQLQILEAKKRAAAQQRAQAAAVTPAPGPGTAYELLVQESELVKDKQRVSVTASTLTQLEAALQSQLDLHIDISVFFQEQAVTAIADLPQKGKIEVRKRVAQVVEVAPAGKEYKLLVCENELLSQKFKVKVTVNSMEELEEAIASKARAAGMNLELNFAVLPWDDDFEEFVDGVKWADFPQTGKVELRPKAAVELEAAEAIAQANARAAEAEAKVAQVAAEQEQARVAAQEERDAAKAAQAEHEEQTATRMAEATAAAEAKMREMEQQAKQLEADLARKEKEAEERAAQKEKEAEERAAQKEREADERAAQKEKEAEERAAQAEREANEKILEMERRQKEKLDKEAADAQAQALANIEREKAKAAEEAAKRQKEQAEEAKAAEAAALGGYADAQSAVAKLAAWMTKEIDKDGDKEVASLLDDLATATHPDIVAAHGKLTKYRKSERERRKREFFAAKRAKESGDSTQAAVKAANEFSAGGDPASAADATAPGGDANAESAGAASGVERVRQSAAQALVSGERVAIEGAITEAQEFEELAEDVEQLRQKLGEAVRAELQAGLTMDSIDTIDDLMDLANKYNEDALGTELEQRKEQAVKINRLLKAAERTTDTEQVQEALTKARELGVFESLCKKIEVDKGLAAPDATGAATAEEAAAQSGSAAAGGDAPQSAAAGGEMSKVTKPLVTVVSAKKVASATKKKVTATATKKKVTATATKKTATATAKKKVVVTAAKKKEPEGEPAS